MTKQKRLLQKLFGFLLAFVLLFSQNLLFSVVPIYAAARTWNFSNSSDYTYDSDNIEISFGQAQLKAPDDWYNSSWHYRKPIMVDNTRNPSKLTLGNYQVRLPVTYDPDMQPDFDDIRFTDSDGSTLINHWLESKTDSISATFWVEVPDIPTSSTKIIYMYYGNPRANSTSDGDATFIFFDDFETGDFSKWGVAEKNWHIENSVVKEGSYSARVTTTEADQGNGYLLKWYIGRSIRIQTWARTDNGTGESCSAGFITFISYSKESYSCSLFFGGPLGDGLGSFRYRCNPGGPTTFPNDKKYSYNTWYKTEVILDFENSLQKTYVDGINLGDIILEDNNQTVITPSGLLRTFGAISATSSGTINFYIDNYRVSQYTSPEPTISFGSEETSSPLVKVGRIIKNMKTGIINFVTMLLDIFKKLFH